MIRVFIFTIKNGTTPFFIFVSFFLTGLFSGYGYCGQAQLQQQLCGKV
jgi:hypothetical protein